MVAKQQRSVVSTTVDTKEWEWLHEMVANGPYNLSAVIRNLIVKACEESGGKAIAIGSDGKPKKKRKY